jgi:hypothetical protein
MCSANCTLQEIKNICLCGSSHRRGYFSYFVRGSSLYSGTPTKRQISKRQVSKRSVSKRLKRQVYKTSGLQNVRSSKRQVAKRPVSKRPY